MKPLQNYVLGCALTLGVSGVAGQVNAQSYTTDYEGTAYDFTYVNGTYNELQATLQDNFFWGSFSTPTPYVTEVGAVLGYDAIQSALSGEPPFGPYFVYQEESGLFNARTYNLDFNSVFSRSIGSEDFDTEYTFAVATLSATTPTPTPVPEIDGKALPLLAFVLSVMMLGLRSHQTDDISGRTA